MNTIRNKIVKYFTKPIAIFVGIILLIGSMNPPTETAQKAQIINGDKKSVNTVLPTDVPATPTIIQEKKATVTPVPTRKYIAPTAKPIVHPTSVPQIQTVVAIPPSQQESGYVCNCAKTCAQLTCSEAQYQLNNCGCSVRDRDKDGIACDAQCQ